ncbi:molybdenum cofactor guanylyltransferase [Prochlorococcus sp. MIT 0604]|uniref:molybdenum cofactor guanylyltransferase n=1 Tax=Prochlorococcus sp. MIT 0604 TaxID=1501268 RepID=UPI0004F8A4E5|nr:molybdenum cofactor guanylyltransferase [Prochlorococcus sp. MIT 0604]AIQ95292.1 hypothetical protein EW14_1279 [Prochlorococcus sp. MIT 0604]AIQ95560.1 Molybdopterin-guanine dinucleotide biosynthesis protein MobA [Prochlorococcus sp. MIT 0604]
MEIKHKKFKAFILAGGKSSRMGFDKALIKHHEGGNWLTHKIKILNTLNLETFVITNHTSHSKEVDKRNNVGFISDAKPFDGPLTCIEQIFSSFKKNTKNILIIPIDMPNLNTKLIYSLIKSWEKNQNSAVVSHDGIFVQPLFGIYPLNEENHFKLKKKLSSGKKNFLGWVDQIPHKYFYANNGDLININSKREFLNMNNGT